MKRTSITIIIFVALTSALLIYARSHTPRVPRPGPESPATKHPELGKTVTAETPLARQWQVKNASTVNASTSYELHNTYRRQLDLSSQLGYTVDARTFSSNREDVGWAGQSGGLFEFRRPNIRDHRTVSPFENLALYNANSRKYLTGSTHMYEAHGDHDYQYWSSSPSYEWQVLDRQGADFALFNTNKRDYIVAADGGRSVLKWLGSASR